MQSNTTLSIKMLNDYFRQLHVSAPTGHLQVVFKRTLSSLKDNLKMVSKGRNM